MPKLVKNNELTEDNYIVLDESAESSFSVEEITKGEYIVSLAYVKAHPEVLSNARLGVWLKSDDVVEDNIELLKDRPVIAVKFAAFADGRSFTQARTLRERYSFEGGIRALGSFIQDQLTYLVRCGVNEFCIDDAVNMDSFIESLHDFTEFYQASATEEKPLFRRR